jgi:biopolymer transport protein ExbB
MIIFKALLSSIIGYDLIIVALILFNIAFIQVRLRMASNKLNSHLKKVIYLPVAHTFKNLSSNDPQKVNLHDLMQLREAETRLYHIYISITNILPLLGILGTVLALMNIESFTTDMITSNFLSALTSTFWGLSGAIICKILEGNIVFKVDLNEENLSMLTKSIIRESGNQK